jgi:peptide/nickel transport system substrate-binding protein
MNFLTLKRRHVLMGLAATTALPSISFAQSGQPVSGGTLKISHSTRIATLNPLSLSGPAEYPCIDMLYSRLTRIGFDSQPHPDLAESWVASPDATEFTLRSALA